MRLTSQRRLASQVLKAAKKRVWFNQEGLLEIKEAITKADIKNLMESPQSHLLATRDILTCATLYLSSSQ